jgi:hypothetical protein
MVIIGSVFLTDIAFLHEAENDSLAGSVMDCIWIISRPIEQYVSLILSVHLAFQASRALLHKGRIMLFLSLTSSFDCCFFKIFHFLPGLHYCFPVSFPNYFFRSRG